LAFGIGTLAALLSTTGGQVLAILPSITAAALLRGNTLYAKVGKLVHSHTSYGADYSSTHSFFATVIDSRAASCREALSYLLRRTLIGGYVGAVVGVGAGLCANGALLDRSQYWLGAFFIGILPAVGLWLLLIREYRVPIELKNQGFKTVLDLGFNCGEVKMRRLYGDG